LELGAAFTELVTISSFSMDFQGHVEAAPARPGEKGCVRKELVVSEGRDGRNNWASEIGRRRQNSPVAAASERKK